MKSSSYLYEPPFSFKPGSEETFTVRGPDIGDIKILNVEVTLIVKSSKFQYRYFKLFGR